VVGGILNLEYAKFAFLIKFLDLMLSKLTQRNFLFTCHSQILSPASDLCVHSEKKLITFDSSLGFHSIWIVESNPFKKKIGRQDWFAGIDSFSNAIFLGRRLMRICYYGLLINALRV